MPSVSQSQQRFMGMVRAYQEGKLKKASPKIREAAKSMSPQDVHDFAVTPHKGLPEHVEHKKAFTVESIRDNLAKMAKIETDLIKQGLDGEKLDGQLCKVASELFS